MIFAVAAVLSFMTAVPLLAQAPAEPAPAAEAEPGAAFVANYDPSKSYSRLLFPNVAAMVGLTPAQQEAVLKAYDTIEDFFDWYSKAKEEYEKDHPPIDIGDGNIDLDSILKDK